MPTVERVIQTPTELTKVWQFLVDFTTTELWDPPTVRTTLTSGDGDVGTTYLNVSTFLGRETEVEYVVTERVEMQRLQIAGRATGVELLDTITFDGQATGTIVTYRSELVPQGAAKLTSPLLGIGLEKLADDAAESMKHRLDSL
jgi:hypothetical protein